MKGDKSKIKCKKCGTLMVATTEPFKATIFGKKKKYLTQFVKCPKCGKRGIERLEKILE